MNFTHIQDKKVRVEVFDMLHEHASMWNEKVGTIRTMEQQIDLKPETRPVRSMTYRQGPSMREHIKTEIKKVLAAGLTGPASIE